MNMQKRVVGLSLCLAATSVFGSDQLEQDLAPVVITATRRHADPRTLPYRAEIIQADTLQMEQLSRTVPEALKFVPGVMPQKTGHAQGSPFIRGFTGFRTLFMIDGIRLNNAVFRDGPNQYWGTVDPYSFERLEIVKGPASSLYGSDAVGGSVNAISASPFGAINEQGFGLRSLIRYSSAEDSWMFRQEASIAAGTDFAARIGLSLKDFGDLKSGGGTLPKTGYEEGALDGSAEWRANERVTWSLVHQSLSQDDAWRVHRTEFAVPFAGSSVGDEKMRVLDQERHLTYLRMQADPVSGFVDHLTATISLHEQDEERFRLRSRDRRDRQGFEVGSLGAQVQFESARAVHDLTYGLEFYRDEVDSFNHTLNPNGRVKSSAIQGPVGDDAQYDSLGVYVQDQVEASERVSLIGGLRYSHFEADIGRFENPITGKADAFSDQWDTVTANARAVIAFSAQHRVYAGVAQGFRAPNLSDLSRLDTARSDELETAATDLDPEAFATFEVGTRFNGEKGTLEISGYYTDIQDMIVTTPTGRFVDGNREVTKRNSGDGYVGGVELGGDCQLSDQLNLRGAVSWMDGEVDTFPSSDPVNVREPMDRLMPVTTHVALRYDIDLRYWLEANVSIVDDAGKGSTRDQRDTQRIPPGGAPGYTVFGLRGGCRLSDQLNLTLALENIGDENYRVHGSGLNEPGRNAIIALEGRW